MNQIRGQFRRGRAYLLPLAFVLLLWAVSPVRATSTLSTTSFGCLPPSLAAILFLESVVNFGIGPVDEDLIDELDGDDCEDFCDEMEDGCEWAIDKSIECWDEILEHLEKIGEILCEEAADEDACEDDLKDFLDELEDIVEEEADFADDDLCDGFEDVCEDEDCDLEDLQLFLDDVEDDDGGLPCTPFPECLDE